jgi:DNA-binding XRE family transcriptional regulator
VNAVAIDLRRKAGLTQVQLAVKASVSPRTIHAIEAGTTTARIDVRRKVLTALGVLPWQEHHRAIFGPLASVGRTQVHG